VENRDAFAAADPVGAVRIELSERRNARRRRLTAAVLAAGRTGILRMERAATVAALAVVKRLRPIARAAAERILRQCGNSKGEQNANDRRDDAKPGIHSPHVVPILASPFALRMPHSFWMKLSLSRSAAVQRAASPSNVKQTRMVSPSPGASGI